MSEKCVFLDRDGTIIEDPGYLSEPEAVRLLPGVDLALRGLRQAGYRLVIVTNQSAIARGMLTEEHLERIHAELRRQLAEHEVHVDAIYYCPYHPEATVEEYARESPDRKPAPGMLLRAAKDLDLDLTGSWMVGNSPADVEAGQRAGCRTVRLRSAADSVHPEDENVQADYTVRNLVDAARVVLGGPAPAAAGAAAAPAPAPESPGQEEAESDELTDSEVLREILDCVRQISQSRAGPEFSASRLVGTIVQVFALVALGVGAIFVPGALDFRDPAAAHESLVAVHVALLAGILLQLAALTAFSFHRRR